MRLLPETARSRWILGLLAAWAVVGCAVPRPTPYVGPPGVAFHGPAVPQVALVGGPRVPHVLHAENGLDCTECHTLDKQTGEPGMPDLALCMGCHEDVDEDKPENERVDRIFFGPDKLPLWRRAMRPSGPDVIFAHSKHQVVGACTTCHGTMEAEQGRPDAWLFDMDGCMECHERSRAPNDCATCHRRLDRNTMPDTHDEAWRYRHGWASRTLRDTATAQRCDLCHNEPQDCDGCHQQEAPRSHKHLWKQRHGEIVRAEGGDLPANCAFCHRDQAFCEDCHRSEEPRSHTTLFRTRTHGVMAALNRQSCATCHATDFCQRCHEDTPPRSHRGPWASGRNTHCATCHFPLASNPGCTVCHRSGAPHTTAPSQPPGHVPGRNCRICHNSAGGGGARPLRHVDNGQSCETCHH